ncbi:MAG: hypothetical protein PHS92_01195 [Candidatus Gracilibacteria bacterium]|nr:hypothetical protein [Candidatus Gracilibacteria bacterium]
MVAKFTEQQIGEIKAWEDDLDNDDKSCLLWGSRCSKSVKCKKYFGSLIGKVLKHTESGKYLGHFGTHDSSIGKISPAGLRNRYIDSIMENISGGYGFDKNHITAFRHYLVHKVCGFDPFDRTGCSVNMVKVLNKISVRENLSKIDRRLKMLRMVNSIISKLSEEEKRTLISECSDKLDQYNRTKVDISSVDFLKMILRRR